MTRRFLAMKTTKAAITVRQARSGHGAGQSDLVTPGGTDGAQPPTTASAEAAAAGVELHLMPDRIDGLRPAQFHHEPFNTR